MGDSREDLRPWAELSVLSDEQLWELFETSTHILASPFAPTSPSVRRIATDAVMKLSISVRESEILTMRLVSQSSSILVPTVRRVVELDDILAVVMDYIPGQPLGCCWPRLSIWKRIHVLWTLRGYIRQMRRIRVPDALRRTVFPGPIASEPQVCHGMMFSEHGAGPFASYEELTAWFMHKLDVNRRIRKYPTEPMTFDSSLPLVLTHNDIHPHNVIVGDDGRVWLVDWGCAGYYPQWFEYTSMVQQWEPILGLGRWERFVLGLMAGFYERQLAFIASIGWALNTGVLL